MYVKDHKSSFQSSALPASPAAHTEGRKNVRSVHVQICIVHVQYIQISSVHGASNAPTYHMIHMRINSDSCISISIFLYDMYHNSVQLGGQQQFHIIT